MSLCQYVSSQDFDIIPSRYSITSYFQRGFNSMKNKYASLTPFQLHVLRDKGTEQPFSGCYETLHSTGTYLCRGCGRALFRSGQQFLSSCGWPSFDDEIQKAVTHVPDMDGRRTEIVCSYCKSHLGHVFYGEALTQKNVRYCVNSLAIDFVCDHQVLESQEAILAGGCFWGVEFMFQKKVGVLKTEVGYTGGTLANPHYDEVCHQNTGHVEAVRVVFDPNVISYKELIKYFFEIHDPTQINRQGPDFGSQYRSALFYYDNAQKEAAETVISMLRVFNDSIVTHLQPVDIFWPAESYHQNYYFKNNKIPYCHHYQKKFTES